MIKTVKSMAKKIAYITPPLSKIIKERDNLIVINAQLREANRQKQLEEKGHWAYFYYKTLPEPRYGWGKPPHKILDSYIRASDEQYLQLLNQFTQMGDFFKSIKLTSAENNDQTLPYWSNQLLPVIDAISICGFIKQYRPNKFIEIGSGNSTRFACHAAKAFSPHTEVISIDPYPGNTINAYPNTFIKEGLENTDLSIFNNLTENDILWMDGSHRAFSNTDVSVFFMDVLPMLPKNMLIGIHDIGLPWDYPPEWNDYYFNESLVLASYLLGAEKNIQYILPCFYINNINLDLRAALKPIWQLPQFKEDIPELKGGGAFWFKKR